MLECSVNAVRNVTERDSESTCIMFRYNVMSQTQVQSYLGTEDARIGMLLMSDLLRFLKHSG